MEVLELPPAPTPSAFQQGCVLLHRRLVTLGRQPLWLVIQAAMLIGFPLIVSAFAWNGFPAIKNMSLTGGTSLIGQFKEAQEFYKQAVSVGTLVSGIAMFQVILITLMAANNSGREVAAERAVLEKEKMAGLHTGASLFSKVAVLLPLCVVQSLAMAGLVHLVCGVPGSLEAQWGFLFLASAAVSSWCLAISAWSPNAETASLASIYLVGFQLPLSGAVLALPQFLEVVSRPLIAAYWGWSGYLQTLREERYYDLVRLTAQTGLSPENLSAVVLVLHIVLGLGLAWSGIQRRVAL